MTLVSSAVRVSIPESPAIARAVTYVTLVRPFRKTPIREQPSPTDVSVVRKMYEIMNGKEQAIYGSDTNVSNVSTIREKLHTRVRSDAYARDLAERMSHAHTLTQRKAT